MIAANPDTTCVAGGLSASAIVPTRIGGDDPLRLHRGFHLDRGS